MCVCVVLWDDPQLLSEGIAVIEVLEDGIVMGVGFSGRGISDEMC